MTTIASNIQLVRGRIAQACAVAQRPVQSVTLLAVSKTYAEAEIRQAVHTGQLLFGENYVQEALDKMAALADLRAQLQWHLIGPLQSNKTRQVAEQFDWVHSVDRLKIAQRLSAQRPENLPALQICLQVNVSRQATKSGVLPEALPALALAVAGLPRLQLRGLMSIAQPTANTAQQRTDHRALAELLRRLQQQSLAVDTLSMGMTGDLEAAIMEGATTVRVGTAIFGRRLLVGQ
jgi:PLP dependent protein